MDFFVATFSGQNHAILIRPVLTVLTPLNAIRYRFISMQKITQFPAISRNLWPRTPLELENSEFANEFTRSILRMQLTIEFKAISEFSG